MERVTRTTSFSARLKQGENFVGTFQKTPHHHITEVLSLTGMHFVVFDAEHSSFDMTQLDLCILAARGADFPSLVRISRNAPDAILSALDLGATGILVPHIRTKGDAIRVSESAHYLSGSRGFSPSTRAGGYGTRGLDNYMRQADLEVTVILQIEDAVALDQLDSIAATPGVAGLFVGRADLAASMKVSWEDAELDRATQAVARACANAGIACGAYLANDRWRSDFSAWGVSFFIVGSDQGGLRTEIARVAKCFHSDAPPKAAT